MDVPRFPTCVPKEGNCDPAEKHHDDGSEGEADITPEPPKVTADALRQRSKHDVLLARVSYREPVNGGSCRRGVDRFRDLAFRIATPAVVRYKPGRFQAHNNIMHLCNNFVKLQETSITKARFRGPLFKFVIRP